MVLEATVVILDNSEWMRNGDFAPSRFDVQQDAASLLVNAKRQSNIENTVAIMTMAGAPEVKVTLTSEQGKLHHALVTSRINGPTGCSLPAALQVAQLVLKNRQNSNQRQRIVVFLGSPLPADLAGKLAGVGKILKKNNVSLDIVSLACVQENASLVTELLAATAGIELATAQENIHEALLAPNCECHYLAVKLGDNLVEELRTSPILLGSDGSSPSGGDFGMDEDMDPELAMALKMSLEEEKSRQEREKANNNSTTTATGNEDANEMAIDEDDEEVLLSRAIAMSMETAKQEQEQNNPNPQ